MKHIILMLAASLFLAAPSALRAREYSDATMRFTLPDDYAYKPFADEKSGFSGFMAEKPEQHIALFRTFTARTIDRTACLSRNDAQWLSALSGFEVVHESRPLWKRYDKVTDYRNGKGCVRVYRYIDRKGIGFLVASSSQPEWEAADRIADSQRYRLTFGHVLDRSWYLAMRLAGYIALALAALGMLYSLREKACKRRFWVVLAVVGVFGGLAIGYEPFFSRKIWMIVTAVLFFLGIYAFDDDGDTEQAMDADGGYDGTGSRFDGDI